MNDPPSKKPDARPDAGEDAVQRVIEQVRGALKSMRYGQLLLLVQDGVVVQIDRTDKTRLR